MFIEFGTKFEKIVSVFHPCESVARKAFKKEEIMHLTNVIENVDCQHEKEHAANARGFDVRSDSIAFRNR